MRLNFLKSLDADDIFISYSREDGSAYLRGLDAALSASGFSCFTDRRGTDANRLPPKTLFRKIRLCKTLVLLGTPSALNDPEYIAPEVSEFAAANGTARIISVSFDKGSEFSDWSNAPWKDHVEGKAREREDPATLKTGQPSASVVETIVAASDYMKSKDRLRKYRNRTIAVLVSLLILSAGAAGVAWYQLRQAATATTKANEEASRAAEATLQAQTALKQSVIAQAEVYVAKLGAEIAKAEASEQKHIAKLASNDAIEKARLAAAASLKAQVAEGMAKKQSAIANSRSLANRSQTLLTEPEALQRSIGLAVEAVNAASFPGTRTVEADSALRESLSFLPRYLDGKPYSGRIGSTALSPDALYFATLTSDKMLRVYEIATQRLVYEHETKFGSNPIALSSKAAYAAVASERTVEIYDLKEGTSHPVKWGGGKKEQEAGERSEQEIEREKGITIADVALSPGGKYLAVILDDADAEQRVNSAEIWGASNGNEIASFDKNIHCNDIAFGATGNLALGVATFPSGPLGNYSGRAVIWSLSNELRNESAASLTKENFPTPEEFDLAEEVLAITPGVDGFSFATDRGVYRRTALGNFKIVGRLPRKEDVAFVVDYPVMNLAFTADGGTLTLVRDMPPAAPSPDEDGNKEKRVEMWEGTEHQDAWHVYQQGRIQTLGFFLDSRTLAAAYNRSSVRTFDIGNKAAPISDEASYAAREITEFTSHDGRFFVTESNKVLEIHDVWRLSKTSLSFKHELENLNAVTVSEDGGFVVLAGWKVYDKDGLAIVYVREGEGYREKTRISLGDKSPFMHFDQPAGSVPMAITPDGQRLVVLMISTFRVWNVATGQDITPTELRESSDIDWFKLSQGGHYVAVVVNVPTDESQKQSQRVLTLRISDNRIVFRTESQPKVTANGFSSLGRYMLTSTEGRASLLTDLQNGTTVTIRHDSPAQSLAFSADDQYFATGSQNGVIQVFSVCEPGVGLIRLEDTGAITAMSFSKDGRLLSTASAHDNPIFPEDKVNYLLRVWHLRSNDLITEATERMRLIPAYLREDIRDASRPEDSKSSCRGQ